MPLDKHLIVHLQEMYANEQAYRDYLQEWSKQLRNQQLTSSVRDQIDGIEMELDHLRQALSMMNASPDEQLNSPFVQALKQEDQFTKQAMSDMTPSDMDVHVAMADIGFGQLEIGMYQGMLNMARALKMHDVVHLLEQTIDNEQEDMRAMQQLLPTLIDESQQQQRAA